MAEISAWDPTDDSNVDLWPEGMLGGTINNSGRAMQGLLARWFRDINGSLSSSGSSNAFTVTSNRTIASLTNGIRLTFVANHTITGAATLNLNTLGAKDIKRFNGSALAAGDIVSGQPVDVIYSSGLDDWIMVSALAALVGSTHADFGENGSPGDPAANTARLYAKDDGAGVTQLAWRNSAGVETLIGTPGRAYATYTTNAALSTVIPLDDTIPQDDEGTEIVTASITPKSTASRVRVTFMGQATGSGNVDGQRAIAALFQDSVANALHATATHVNSNEGSAVDEPAILGFVFEHSPATVSAVTYKVRVGANSGSMRMNGTASARWFGGVSAATLTLQEIFA